MLFLIFDLLITFAVFLEISAQSRQMPKDEAFFIFRKMFTDFLRNFAERSSILIE